MSMRSNDVYFFIPKISLNLKLLVSYINRRSKVSCQSFWPTLNDGLSVPKFMLPCYMKCCIREKKISSDYTMEASSCNNISRLAVVSCLLVDKKGSNAKLCIYGYHRRTEKLTSIIAFVFP